VRATLALAAAFAVVVIAGVAVEGTKAEIARRRTS
jgi:hypothetical protein